MSQILVVDDEPAIRRLLETILVRAGHAPLAAADAGQALARFAQGGLDAVFLDLGLPDRDGLEVLATIRSASAVPVIVLTARHDTGEKIAALDLGADDYVTKPFDADELLARLRTIMRRTDRLAAEERPLAFGTVTMDIARHQVLRNGEPVPLTPREFSVLKALLEAGGRILTHAALLERVWGKAHVEDVDYLRVVVRALRVKLEIDPARPRLIRNEPGIGYRLAD